MSDKKKTSKTKDIGKYATSIKPTPYTTPTIDKNKLTNFPARNPKNIPNKPPINPINIDSVKNKRFTSSEDIPKAFIKPISLVRSNKDTVSVLNIPKDATPKATLPNSPNASLRVENKLFI